MKLKISALALALSAATGAQAAPVSIDAAGTTTYTQSFDSLTNSTTISTWANDSTLEGWSLFNATGAAISSYSAANGSSNAGGFFSFGSAGSTDRALGGTGSGGGYFGSPASGAIAGYMALALTNTGSTDISSFDLSFDGEQWRNGGNTSAQPMVLEYGFGNTFASVSGWTAAGAAFNFISPVAGSTAAALDGNAAANRVASLGGTVTTNWAAGQTLWLRWAERNDVGNDHGLALDNVSLTVSNVPEPETYALALAGLGVAGFLARRRSV